MDTDSSLEMVFPFTDSIIIHILSGELFSISQQLVATCFFFLIKFVTGYKYNYVYVCEFVSICYSFKAASLSGMANHMRSLYYRAIIRKTDQ